MHHRKQQHREAETRGRDVATAYLGASLPLAALVGATWHVRGLADGGVAPFVNLFEIVGFDAELQSRKEGKCEKCDTRMNRE